MSYKDIVVQFLEDNKEIKRRSKVAEAFPSEESLLRGAVAILIDINEERFLSRRYLSIDYQAVWGCRIILQHFLDTTALTGFTGIITHGMI